MAAATVAADAAPRSASSSADSYIGSLISLTSKSEIRYEGVLFNINTEESSIGLKNVRSFGTEGRKKDGPQVPPSDKVYEYILFRGSDIKDLQVKSSPPVQAPAPIHNDPAIIQSHYPQAALPPSTSLPASGIRPVPDLVSHTPQIGGPRPPFQGSLPLYQPGRGMGSWGSLPTPPTTDASGLPMPMYWPGYYAPPNGLQPQQQPLLRPPLGVSVPPSMQQAMQYPPMSAPLMTGPSNLPASPLPEYPSTLLPPYSSGFVGVQPSALPAQSSTFTVSDSSTDTIPDRASSQSLPALTLSTSLQLTPSLTTVLDKNAIAPPVSEKPLIAPDPIMPLSSVSEPMPSIVGSSSLSLNEAAKPSLITPGQLLQPGPSTLSSSQPSHTAQKDVEVIPVSSSDPPPPSSTTVAPALETTDRQEPILPLPTQANHHRQHGYNMYNYQNNRRGRGRGRGNEISRSATKFTEDFDFTAMNEKFNKDEVWGHLGKGSKAVENGEDAEDVEGVGTSKVESKQPVYVKDDFFDSLSCDALDGERNGRPRFSEQSRRDTETFGDFSRYRGGRGGRGYVHRGGRSRGGYYGRGYGGPGGRGRGYGRSNQGNY